MIKNLRFYLSNPSPLMSGPRVSMVTDSLISLRVENSLRNSSGLLLSVLTSLKDLKVISMTKDF